jgi:hypothetical protein
MNLAIDKPSAAQTLKDFVATLSDSRRFKAFLDSHLADDAIGTMPPRVMKSKGDIIRKLALFISMGSGGSFSLIDTIEDENAAAARVLYTGRKHDLTKKWIEPEGSRLAYQGVIWIELNGEGKIAHLHLLGDSLTPSLATGMRMVGPSAAQLGLVPPPDA